VRRARFTFNYRGQLVRNVSGGSIIERVTFGNE
jgi:hypothetical protein